MSRHAHREFPGRIRPVGRIRTKAVTLWYTGPNLDEGLSA
jgi:hypothetical protein